MPPSFQDLIDSDSGLREALTEHARRRSEIAEMWVLQILGRERYEEMRRTLEASDA